MDIKKVYINGVFAVTFAVLTILIKLEIFELTVVGISTLFNLSAKFIENALFISSILLCIIFTIRLIAKIKVNIKKDKNSEVNNIETFKGDFEDKELNHLIHKIKNKVIFLQNNHIIKKDIESSLMLEQIQSEYLNAIHESYISIPASKRGNINIPNSSYDLTMRQLNLILDGLDKIEDRMVENNMDQQKVTEVFLKEKIISL